MQPARRRRGEGRSGRQRHQRQSVRGRETAAVHLQGLPEAQQDRAGGRSNCQHRPEERPADSGSDFEQVPGEHSADDRAQAEHAEEQRQDPGAGRGQGAGVGVAAGADGEGRGNLPGDVHEGQHDGRIFNLKLYLDMMSL